MQTPLLLLFLSILVGTTTAAMASSLSKARQLEVPVVSKKSAGETENLEFWQEHEVLIQHAWEEWADDAGKKLPDLSEDIVMNEAISQQVHNLWNKPSVEKEEEFQKKSWDERIPGVYTCPHFLSDQGIRNIRQHLKASSESGIPTRRPNGMNRYGLVLDKETQGGVSYPEMDDFRTWLVDTYVRPLGRMFFPEYIGTETDDVSSYAFTIHYEPETKTGGDVELKEHSDASVVTININLNLPGDEEEEEDYEGSSLVFVDEDSGNRTSLQMEPGMAVIHRGLHRHQALPIQIGQRHQLIIWLFGTYGYVRFVPYEDNEHMSVQKRWSKKRRAKVERNSDRIQWEF